MIIIKSTGILEHKKDWITTGILEHNSLLKMKLCYSNLHFIIYAKNPYIVFHPKIYIYFKTKNTASFNNTYIYFIKLCFGRRNITTRFELHFFCGWISSCLTIYADESTRTVTLRAFHLYREKASLLYVYALLSLFLFFNGLVYVRHKSWQEDSILFYLLILFKKTAYFLRFTKRNRWFRC